MKNAFISQIFDDLREISIRLGKPYAINFHWNLNTQLFFVHRRTEHLN